MSRDLLTDVNLSEMTFSGSGSALSLEFLDMVDGSPVDIVCERASFDRQAPQP